MRYLHPAIGIQYQKHLYWLLNIVVRIVETLLQFSRQQIQLYASSINVSYPKIVLNLVSDFSNLKSENTDSTVSNILSNNYKNCHRHTYRFFFAKRFTSMYLYLQCCSSKRRSTFFALPAFSARAIKLSTSCWRKKNQYYSEPEILLSLSEKIIKFGIVLRR